VGAATPFSWNSAAANSNFTDGHTYEAVLLARDQALNPMTELIRATGRSTRQRSALLSTALRRHTASYSRTSILSITACFHRRKLLRGHLGHPDHAGGDKDRSIWRLLLVRSRQIWYPRTTCNIPFIYGHPGLISPHMSPLLPGLTQQFPLIQRIIQARTRFG